MPRVRPKRRRVPKYSEYKKKLIAQAKKDNEFNRFLILQKAREPFSFFSVQPEDFFEFTPLQK
jgi:hypothetical protein